MTGGQKRGGDALTEEVWIRKAQGGDETAFRRLVERYSPVVWTVINRMVGDASVAEDLFQETVIRFWRGLPSFQGASKLSTWLYRIAYRVCLDGIEASGRHGQWVSLDEQLEPHGEWFTDEDASGARLESRLAAKDAVRRALDRLDPEWRTMVILHYWRGLSMEEIAQIVDRPANTVKVYLHRARALLRRHLESGGWPEGASSG